MNSSKTNHLRKTAEEVHNNKVFRKKSTRRQKQKYINLHANTLKKYNGGVIELNKKGPKWTWTKKKGKWTKENLPSPLEYVDPDNSPANDAAATTDAAAAPAAQDAAAQDAAAPRANSPDPDADGTYHTPDTFIPDPDNNGMYHSDDTI